ncbi:Flagellar assembly regulator FliX [Candidatus Terasakiella magnetica]|uniref:Flagellar assembly regulator FliX n=1 Tax=Candidatus Terasakiella magnetica TaxID=1867952 RepID=A0A1C3RL47_9PROT|nr:flagellar assembly protein FliX [Candidatus Terasakiella magnetica]SCA57879.1 Flagellar assembly regulator FliX [Candidatus Terasakiella magnetica]
MKISNVGPSKPAVKSTKKEGTGKSGGFSTHLNRATGGNEGQVEFQEVNPVASMDSILSIQEVGDATEEENRRALFQRGEDILERLSEIQREILAGGISVERLQNLAHLLRSRRETVEDPALQQIIDEIELRAEVEIAKWGRNK